MARLMHEYKEVIRPEFLNNGKFGNIMAVPKIDKISLNIGLGEAVQNNKVVKDAENELALISGQKPVITRAKKSIATFKLRQGMPIGCKVTLRNKSMYEFLDRFINIVLPRVKDFSGISPKSFDGRGNFSMGIQEQVVFPEIDFDTVSALRGLNVNIITTTNNDNDALLLLQRFGVPFRKS